MQHQPTIQIDRTPVLIDELADLCEYWKKHRAAGRTPAHIQSAILAIAGEVALRPSSVLGIMPSDYNPTAARIHAEPGASPAGQ